MKMSQFMNTAVWVYVMAAAAIFVFFRLYQLPETLLVYNDMGRDFVVLQDWIESGKPPLLGPQTSVISYNQSAWYFYILLPLFLLTGQSAFSSTLTLVLVGLAIFSLLVWKLRHNREMLLVLSTAWLLMSVHPQVVLQNRFIWNPSFLPMFLIASVMALIQLRAGFSLFWASVFWLGAAFSVGFSYSSVPLVLFLTIWLILMKRQKWLKHLALAIAAAMIVLLPLIAFEVRHGLVLTKLLFVGQTTPQTGLSIAAKSRTLQEFVVPGSQVVISILTALVLVVWILPKLPIISWVGRIIHGAAAIGVVLFSLQLKHDRVRLLATLMLITLILLFSYFVLPVGIEKHYVFPLITMLIMVVSALPGRLRAVCAAALILTWLSPANRELYMSTPPRTVADAESCYRAVCAKYTDPIYVSMESGILPGYHNAPDHRYFLRKAGCQVPDIEQSQDLADTMLVVNDGGQFSPGRSGYRELSLFGPYLVGETTQCTDHLSVVEIVKADPSQVGAELPQ